MITAIVQYKLPPHINFAACAAHFRAIAPGFRALPLSFQSCVPFREIRLRDADGVGDFPGMAGAALGCGPS